MPEYTRYENESPSEFRRRMREKAQGMSSKKLRKRSKKVEDGANPFRNVLQNRRLRSSKPNWAKKAGFTPGLFTQLEKARQSDDPRGGTRTARLEGQADAFKAKRAKMLERLEERRSEKLFTGGTRRKKKRVETAGKPRRY